MRRIKPRESRLAEENCPLCGSDYVLKYWDKDWNPWHPSWYYCPECDTLFNEDWMALVKTVEPHADFGTFLKGLR